MNIVNFSNYKATKIIFITCSVFYISLCLHLPVSIRALAVHDDALFWSQAMTIIDGHWLGPYNQITLLKGQTFPLFIALNHIIGTPITLFIAMFYLFSIFTLLKTINDTLSIKPIYHLMIFILLIFHPLLLPINIIRDNIYPGMTLLLISGLIRLTDVKREVSLKVYLFFGTFFGFFWLTREEGLWVAPAIIVMLALKTINKNNQNLQKIAKRTIFAFSISLIPILGISSINYLYYGKFQTTESWVSNGSYSRALKSLYSIDIGNEIAHVPVQLKKREVAYSVSPSFSKLRTYFETSGKVWTQFGCSIYPDTCGDYAGGWFIVALRDAAASIGKYNNAVESDNFYQSIYREIESACESKKIKCKKNLVPFMPNITKEQLKEIPAKIIQGIRLITLQSDSLAFANESSGSSNQLNKAKAFLGFPRSTNIRNEENAELHLTGWYYHPDMSWIRLKCEKSDKEIKKLSSPDIAIFFKDKRASYSRFEVYDDQNCTIASTNKDSNFIELNKLSKNNFIFNGGQLWIDETNKDYFVQNEELSKKIKGILYAIYKVISPCLFLVGITFFLYSTYMIASKKNHMTDLFILTSTLWLMLMSRIILLVLVDITSFPGITPLYLSSGFCLLILASILSLCLGKD